MFGEETPTVKLIDFDWPGVGEAGEAKYVPAFEFKLYRLDVGGRRAFIREEHPFHAPL